MNRMPADDELRGAAAENKDVHAALAEGHALPPSPRGAGWFLVRALVAVLLLAAAVLAWKWMMATAPHHAPRPAPEKSEPVRIAPVQLTSARPEWVLYGTAQAPRKVSLRMAVSGQVVETAPDLKAGLAVKKGQLLVRVDDLPYRATLKETEAQLAETRALKEELNAKLALEKTALANAREQLAIARREYDRAARLFKRGVVAQAEVDKRRTTLAAKELAVAQREANVKGLMAQMRKTEATTSRLEWARQRAQRNVADTVLRAPFSGVITEAQVNVGQHVSPSDRLITLVDEKGREVTLSLSERRYGALKAAGEKIIGRTVSVIWDTADGPVTMSGHVVRVTPAVASGKGSVTLHVRLKDAKKARWLPDGAFIAARMQGPLKDKVALLPEAAVHDAAKVFTVRADGRMHAVPVRIVGYVGNQVAVTGLKEGMRVIISRIAEPVEGRKVRILNEKQAALSSPAAAHRKEAAAAADAALAERRP